MDDALRATRWWSLMPVEKPQAQMLATLAVACRPIGAPRWDEAGVMAAIAKVKHLALADVCHAVIRAADSRDARTPGVISNLASPCWVERPVDRPTPLEPYDAETFCDVCGKQLPCGGTDHEPISAAEWLARMTPPDPERHTAAALKQLAACETEPEPAKAAGPTEPDPARVEAAAEVGS